jgi:hypothetical protein
MYRLTTDKAAAVNTDFYWVPASKMIASAKVQVEYSALRNEPWTKLDRALSVVIWIITALLAATALSRWFV